MQRFVLDTNVLIAAISDRSPHHWIWLNLTQYKSFDLYITIQKFVLFELEEGEELEVLLL